MSIRAIWVWHGLMLGKTLIPLDYHHYLHDLILWIHPPFSEPIQISPRERNTPSQPTTTMLLSVGIWWDMVGSSKEYDFYEWSHESIHHPIDSCFPNSILNHIKLLFHDWMLCLLEPPVLCRLWTNQPYSNPTSNPFPSDFSTATRGTLEPDAEERIDAGRFTLQALVLKGLGVPWIKGNGQTMDVQSTFFVRIE